MHPAQMLAVKQEVLRTDTRKLHDWAQAVLDADDPTAALQQTADSLTSLAAVVPAMR
jgi:phosphotransferase system enzyme I (PtsI)